MESKKCCCSVRTVPFHALLLIRSVTMSTSLCTTCILPNLELNVKQTFVPHRQFCCPTLNSLCLFVCMTELLHGIYLWVLVLYRFFSVVHVLLFDRYLPLAIWNLANTNVSKETAQNQTKYA